MKIICSDQVEQSSRDRSRLAYHSLVGVSYESVTNHLISYQIISYEIYFYICHRSLGLYKNTCGDMDVKHLPLEIQIWIL